MISKLRTFIESLDIDSLRNSLGLISLTDEKRIENIIQTYIETIVKTYDNITSFEDLFIQLEPILDQYYSKIKSSSLLLLHTWNSDYDYRLIRNENDDDSNSWRYYLELSSEFIYSNSTLSLGYDKYFDDPLTKELITDISDRTRTRTKIKSELQDSLEVQIRAAKQGDDYVGFKMIFDNFFLKYCTTLNSELIFRNFVRDLFDTIWVLYNKSHWLNPSMSSPRDIILTFDTSETSKTNIQIVFFKPKKQSWGVIPKDWRYYFKKK